MSDEMRKSTERRLTSEYYRRYAMYFAGVGLDIGCGYDKMSALNFPRVTNIDGYDQCLGNGNAEHLADIPDNSYDFIVSSHCLEHMQSPEIALSNWIRVTKPGGHLVITIPDWEMYEHKLWPSRFNGDHKTAWTTNKDLADKWYIMHVGTFISGFTERIAFLGASTIIDGFDISLPETVDQTAGPAECAIEIILRKI